MDETTSAQKTNWNTVIQKTSFRLNAPCLTERITAETAKVPVKNKEKQSKKNNPIENGIVKIENKSKTLNAKISAYAGI